MQLFILNPFLKSLFIGLLLCIMPTFSPAYCQKRHIELQRNEKFISLEDGLPNRHINGVFIDRKQRSWFLTDNKISLYERGKIQSFKISDQFSNHGFNAAVEDAEGNFWISENFDWYFPFDVQRCVVFNPKTHASIPVAQYIHQRLNIHSIAATPEGTVFISTKQGDVYRFDASGKLLKHIVSLTDSPVKLLYAGSKGLVVCLSKSREKDDALLQLDINGRILRRISTHALIHAVIDTGEKLFYTYAQNGWLSLCEIGGTVNKQFKTETDDYLCRFLYLPEQHYFVFNQGNALSVFDQQFNLLYKKSFPFLIHSFSYDDFGNVAIATSDGAGFLRFNPKKIRTYLVNTVSENNNDNFSCRQILKIDSNQLIVNTNKRRQLIDLQKGTVKALHEFQNLSGPNYRFVLTALKDPNGDLLFGESTLVKTSLQSAKDETLCNITGTKIWAMSLYKQGYLLGLEKAGMMYYDKLQRKAIPLPSLSRPFKNDIIYGFAVLPDRVLVASEAGLYQFSDEHSIRQIRFPLHDAHQMACFSIIQDKKDPNRLLIATLHGIWVYDNAAQTLFPFIKDKAYHHKKYHSAYRTRNGVWASSEEGVWQFDDAGHLLKIHTAADGLSSNECNRLAHYQDENDVLYLGGVNGINILNPADFLPQKGNRFQIYLDSVSVYADGVKNRQFIQFNPSQLSLDRDEEEVAMTVTYEDFKYSCDKKYYYRLDQPSSDEWIPIPHGHLILSHLKPGHTGIEIRAVSCDDFAGACFRKITIYRPKPLYAEWYFWVIVLAAFSTMTWLSIRFATYQLQRRNEALQKRVDEQTQSLKENLTLKETLLSLLVHDVRYPVQSFYDVSKKLAYLTQKNDQQRLILLGKEAESKSRKVLWLIEELVYWVRNTQQNEKVPLKECDLSKIVLQIFDSYSEEMDQKELSCPFDGTPACARVDYGLMLIVLRNIIFNAIVHAKPQTQIEVSITQTDGQHQFIIRNETTPERSPEERGMGVGMTLICPLLKKAGVHLETTEMSGVFTSKITY